MAPVLVRSRRSAIYYGHYIMERHVTPISICLPSPPFHPGFHPFRTIWELPIVCFPRLSMFEGALDLYKFHKIFGVPIASQVHVHAVVEYNTGRFHTISPLPFSSSSGTRNSERVSQKSDHRPLLRSTLTGIGYSDFPGSGQQEGGSDLMVEWLPIACI